MFAGANGSHMVTQDIDEHWVQVWYGYSLTNNSLLLQMEPRWCSGKLTHLPRLSRGHSGSIPGVEGTVTTCQNLALYLYCGSDDDVKWRSHLRKGM